MSSTDVAKLQSSLPAFTQEQVTLITNTIAKGATKDELQLFLYRCHNMGLDPLKPGQIYFIKYGNSPGNIVVGIEGFRSKAAKTGQVAGIERGVTRDEKGLVIEGWAKVYRKGWDRPAHETVPMAEYNTGKGNWAKMPQTMIKKVAEAAALRMAFPDDLGGVYIKEEMDQASTTGDGNPAGGVHPGTPGPDDGHQADPRTLGKFTRGSFAKRGPGEVDISKLRMWAEGLESRLANPKQPLSPDDKDEWEWNLKLAVDYITEFETNDVPDFGNEPGAED